MSSMAYSRIAVTFALFKRDWQDIVGPQLGAVSGPTALDEDGTLHLWVATPAWQTDLAELETELIAHFDAVQLFGLPTDVRGTRIRRLRSKLQSAARSKGE
jgi:Dna[CI] antecedent DciA-like protein